MFGAVGLYIGTGLSGKLKTTFEFMGIKETEEVDVEWSNDENLDFFK